MVSYELRFLAALAYTVVLETAVLFGLMRMFPGAERSSRKLLLFTGAFASFATLPYAWFVIPAFIRIRGPYMVVSEVSVTLIEAMLFNLVLRLGSWRALIFSAVCNGASFVSGLIVLRWLP